MSARKAKKITFAVIDAETDPFDGATIPAPFIWGFYDGENYADYDETEDLAAAVAGYDGIVYAHSGGKFDFFFLLDYIEPYEEIMIISGRISKMKLGLAELRDSYNIIPAPLSAYKKDEFDYSNMLKQNRDKPAVRKLIREYLKNDCVYTHELVSRFIDEYGLSLTQAGSSMKQWKKIAPIDVPVTDVNFYEALSPFYYGGRVQCFEKGIIDADFSVFDINSAYGYAMLFKHPYSGNYQRYEGYHEKADFVVVRGIADGCFPYRDGTGLSFPTDRYCRDFFVSRWEFDAAIETNSLHAFEVLESLVFCGHMEFSEYIYKFYNKRLECEANGDNAGKLLNKLHMLGLYGKFAANPDKYKCYCPFPMDQIASMADCGWEFSGEFGPWALGEAPLPEEKRRYYNVATGASITGFVRAMLWRAIAGSGRVLYCDTDSLALVGTHNLEIGDKLGQWKHEGDFFRAGIAGKKMYIFEGAGNMVKTASKGVRLTDAQLWDMAGGEVVKYHPMAPSFSVRKTPQHISRTVRMT